MDPLSTSALFDQFLAQRRYLNDGDAARRNEWEPYPLPPSWPIRGQYFRRASSGPRSVPRSAASDSCW